jgi:hypothetical protein
MKRLGIIFAVVLILVITGGLTAQIASSGGELKLPGLVRQTDNPDASALDMAPWKAEQLFLLVGFLLFNLVGIAVTLLLVMWFLNSQIKKVKVDSVSRPPSETVPELAE